ncbi:MAG: ATP-binding cassette domain-containing protein [bacterium]|nr:ATP-binding cassette domain-containing protein [bacterium]
MLKVRDLKIHGLEPISFDLQCGDVLVVRGPSGSGKSLLLRAIADLDETSGSIFFDQMSKNDETAGNWRVRVRYLAAESGWWLERVEQHFTNVSAARSLGKDLALEDKLFDSPVAHLSSGERQRMAFIRAIENEPTVLLLDEPTSALDEETGKRMEDKIGFLQKSGVILIIVTHSNEQASRLATHVLTIKDGAARIESA